MTAVSKTLTFILSMILIGIIGSTQICHSQSALTDTVSSTGNDTPRSVGDFKFGVDFSGARPIKEFAEIQKTKKDYFGIGVNFSGRIKRETPFLLGFDAGYYWMGSDRESSSHGDYRLITKIRGVMVPVHLTFQIDPSIYTDFPMLPYVAGKVGWRSFIIDSNLKVDYYDSNIDDEHQKLNHSSSFAISYGYEVGINLKTNEGVIINIKYERLYGGHAYYIDPSSIVIHDVGDVTYDRLNSKTDVDIISFGILFQFGSLP